MLGTRLVEDKACWLCVQLVNGSRESDMSRAVPAGYLIRSILSEVAGIDRSEQDAIPFHHVEHAGQAPLAFSRAAGGLRPSHQPHQFTSANMTPKTPKLGVLQLKTAFARPPGDVGHPLSWGDIPVVIRVVEEADTGTVVNGSWGQELIEAFVREGKRLMQEEGCVAFVTSCGFVSVAGFAVAADSGQLATMHPELAGRLPFMGTTSLLQVAWLQQSLFPGPDMTESVGIITFKKSSLVGVDMGFPLDLSGTTDQAWHWYLMTRLRST